MVMPSQKHNILEFMTSDKMPYIFYSDLKFFIKTMDGRVNIPEKPSAAQIWKHSLSGY